MADYFTKLSFGFTGKTEELAALSAALHSPETALTPQEIEHFDLDPDFLYLDLDHAIEGETLCIWSESSPNLDLLAHLVKRFCPSSLPVSFQYSWDCTKPRLDAFGGGACVITKDEVRFKTTNDLVGEMLS